MMEFNFEKDMKELEIPENSFVFDSPKTVSGLLRTKGFDVSLTGFMAGAFSDFPIKIVFNRNGGLQLYCGNDVDPFDEKFFINFVESYLGGKKIRDKDDV